MQSQPLNKNYLTEIDRITFSWNHLLIPNSSGLIFASAITTSSVSSKNNFSSEKENDKKYNKKSFNLSVILNKNLLRIRLVKSNDFF